MARETVTIDDLAETVTFPDLAQSVTIPGFDFAAQMEHGEYTLTGQDVEINRAYVTTLDSGSYTLTGQAVTLIQRIMTADQGAYSLTGQAVGFNRDLLESLSSGAYSLSGQDAAVIFGYAFPVDQGAYSLTGQAIGTLYDSVVSLAQGSYTLTGQDVSLDLGYYVAAGNGSYTLTGQTLDFLPSSHVQLLLHLDGADESTSTTDSSTYAHTINMWTSFSLRIDQDNKKFGTASWRFSGAVSLASTTYSTTAFDWWTDDYTLEMWVDPDSLTGAYLVGNMTNSATTKKWMLSITTGGELEFMYDNGSTQTVTSSGASITTGSWHHIAMVHTGGNIYLYANGSRVASTTVSGTPTSSTGLYLMFGRSYMTNYLGHMDEVRILKGTAAYTGATYTVPTAAFPTP